MQAERARLTGIEQYTPRLQSQEPCPRSCLTLLQGDTTAHTRARWLLTREPLLLSEPGGGSLDQDTVQAVPAPLCPESSGPAPEQVIDGTCVTCRAEKGRFQHL